MNFTYFEQYKYCPRCKGNVAREENTLRCTKCKFKFYINPVGANGAILTNKKGEVLLIERAVEPKKGYIDVPGGFIDLNETAEESMTRELQEELHLDIPPSAFTYFCGPYGPYYYQKEFVPTICFMFTAPLPEDQTPHSGDDAGKIRYFKPSEIPLDKVAFSGVLFALEKYMKENSSD